MNESEHKDDSEVLLRTRCKLKFPQKESEDGDCYVKEGQLVIDIEQPIVIPLRRIEVHRTGGPASNEVEIIYLNELNKKQHLSLEMAEAAYFNYQLSSAISKAKMQWLESLPIEQRYVGFWRRFAASFLDGIILNIISWILFFILSFFPYWASIAVGIAFFIGSIIYYPVFWVWQGATPGKMIMGVKIVRTDGSPIGIGRAFLRYVGYFVSAIIIYIGYLMIAWDSKKQGLHDKIADTCVIRVE